MKSRTHFNLQDRKKKTEDRIDISRKQIGERGKAGKDATNAKDLLRLLFRENSS